MAENTSQTGASLLDLSIDVEPDPQDAQNEIIIGGPVLSSEVEKLKILNLEKYALPFDSHHDTDNMKLLWKHLRNKRFFKRILSIVGFAVFCNSIFILQLLLVPNLANFSIPFIPQPTNYVDIKGVDSNPVVQLGLLSSLVYTVCALVWIVASPIGALFQVSWLYISRNQKIRSHMESFQAEYEYQEKQKQEFHKQILEMENKYDELEQVLEDENPIFDSQKKMVVIAYDYIIATLQPIAAVNYKWTIALYAGCCVWLVVCCFIQWFVTLDGRVLLSNDSYLGGVIVMILLKGFVQNVGTVFFLVLSFFFVILQLKDLITYHDHLIYMNNQDEPSSTEQQTQQSQQQQAEQPTYEEEENEQTMALNPNVIISTGFFENHKKGSIFVFCGWFIVYQSAAAKQTLPSSDELMLSNIQVTPTAPAAPPSSSSSAAQAPIDRIELFDDMLVIKLDHIEDISVAKLHLKSVFYHTYPKNAKLMHFLVMKYNNGKFYGISFESLNRKGHVDGLLTSLKTHCSFLSSKITEFELLFKAKVEEMKIEEQRLAEEYKVKMEALKLAKKQKKPSTELTPTETQQKEEQSPMEPDKQLVDLLS